MRQIFVATIALLGLATAAQANDSIRCDGSIVSVGTSKVNLLGKCGQPTSRESHVEERTTFTGDPAQQTTSEKRVTVTVEHWTYDAGSGDFVRTIAIENGVVVSIAEGGYGSAAGRTERAGKVHVSHCDPLHDFSIGDTMDQVLARCGEPASREHKQVERLDTSQDSAGVVTGNSSAVEIEEWTYNFGASSFTRVLHFRDGKLSRVGTGGYGFGP